MKLKKWLKTINSIGLNCNIYIDEEEEPIYCGSMFEIPWWLVDLPLAEYNNPVDKEPPIWFANNIRKTLNDENGTKDYNGFIIILTEQEKE